MLALWWAACSGSEPQPAATPEPAPCHEEVPAAEASAASVYGLEIPLETAGGEQAGLDLHRGQPVLLTMVYATCTDVCPATITVLQGVEARLPPEERDRVRVLLVSLDPQRDTPAALAALGERHGLGPRWTLARTPADRVRELAAALGVRYRARADGGIDHSTVIALLDGDGVVRARLDSLAQPVDGLVEAVRGL